MVGVGVGVGGVDDDDVGANGSVEGGSHVPEHCR